MMKHMVYLTVPTYRMLAISPAFGHSLIGSMPSFGQEILSSTI
jgi:hypothetical protein